MHWGSAPSRGVRAMVSSLAQTRMCASRGGYSTVGRSSSVKASCKGG